ncbi:MAG: tRNA threonylcarbamoyl adenosine modification protein YjeE [Acidimicrobiales bacterium]|nr:tRNA threonylcarbamoyl adenosine modification protein YjeE [Acidimicrobiales bacterium]
MRPIPLQAVTSEPAQTRAVGAALASVAGAGDLLVLAGEMGAGKTAFAQGFGAGLGVDEPITSPTFTIVREYVGRELALNHVDVYRLDHLQEASDLGLGEMLDEAAVMLVEWGDAILPALPPDYLEVRITFGDGDDDRRLEIVTVGPRWSARYRTLTEVLGPWLAGGPGPAC